MWWKPEAAERGRASQGTVETTSCRRGEDQPPGQQGWGWAARGPQATALWSSSQTLPGSVPASSFLLLLSQVRAHLSNSPRCTTGSVFLHSSLYSKEMFAQILSTPRQQRLDQSGPIYWISLVSHQQWFSLHHPPPKGREIFPRPPPSQLCFLGRPQWRPRRQSKAVSRFHPWGPTQVQDQSAAGSGSSSWGTTGQRGWALSQFWGGRHHEAGHC